MRRVLLVLAAAVLVVSGCRPRAAQTEVAVFFTRSEGTAFVLAEVRRPAAHGDAASRVHAALEQLLAGPTAAERARGLSTAVPAGTRLRDVRVRDGVAWVDLSREIESGGGSASMLGRVWQIVYTATQFPEAPRVRILIEGRERTALGGEGVIIEKPLERPSTPPRF